MAAESPSLRDLEKLPAVVESLVARCDQLETLLALLTVTADVQVPSAEAMRLTGIKSDTTLRAAEVRGELAATRQGRSVTWSRNSCLLYAYRASGRLLPAALLTVLEPKNTTARSRRPTTAGR